MVPIIESKLYLIGTYEQGWDDCIDVLLSILSDATDIKTAKDKVESLQIMVKAKKFRQLKADFGVVGDLF